MNDVSAKLIELAPDVFVIPGATNAGAVFKQADGITQVYLIDSGTSELDADVIFDTLKKYFSEKSRQFKIAAIINTHCHPDHVGADNAIQTETECEIWCPAMERGCLENPEMQPSLMYGGYPPKELHSLFFMIKPAKPSKMLYDGDSFNFNDGTGLKFIDLPGHSFQEMAVIYELPDGSKIVFSGDAVYPRKRLAKFWISFIYNPHKFMQSLDKLDSIKNIKYCIPSHGEFITDDLSEVIELNKIAVYSVEKTILNILKTGKASFEQILKGVTDYHDIKMAFAQHVLIGCTLKSYLAVMCDKGEITCKVEENILYYYLKK